MHTVTIEIPEGLGKKELLLSFAEQLYQKELISVEQAADLAGIDVKEFVKIDLSKSSGDHWLSDPKSGQTMEELFQEQIRERGYTGANKKKADALRDKLDIQEPLELLLSQLTK